MKKTLYILALLIALSTVGTWLATGAHVGWTTTSVQVKTLDEVTGIEQISYKPKFTAGVEVLGGGLGVAATFAIASLFFRRPNTKTNQTNN
jgi:hypothetical protein